MEEVGTGFGEVVVELGGADEHCLAARGGGCLCEEGENVA